MYGLVTLKRPGAKQHDFFAGVRVAPKHVAFHLMPSTPIRACSTDVSPALRKQLKGKTTFDFTTVDEALFTELEALTARSFEAYMAGRDGAMTLDRELGADVTDHRLTRPDGRVVAWTESGVAGRAPAPARARHARAAGSRSGPTGRPGSSAACG